ncbi:hypothetical protein [Pseudomonas bohemica]|uniref:hypothetical protein n=1 Tax=Pseudomonas bohemica TaxID=2044872 RepID=UPI000DA61E72|nr:hypothetical protein [Pseudomonas bohemica]
MCIWFEVTPLHGNPAEVETSTELAAIVGCDESDLPTHSGLPMENECLCDLDIEAFEAKFNYRHDGGETTFDNYLIEKESNVRVIQGCV